MSLGRIAAVGVAAALVAGCGRTALDLGESAEGTGTAGDTTTSDGTTDTGSETDTGVDPDGTDDGSFIPDEDTGETGMEPLSCRDMLMCIFGCVADFDPQCFADCGAGADPAESQAAVGLLTCIAGLCVQNEQCTFTDFAAEDCLTCIGLGLFLPSPTGCEDEAEACK